MFGISPLWRWQLASLSLYVGILAFGFSKGLAGKSHGFTICRSAAPRPTCEVSTCIVMGSEGVKVPEGGVTDDTFFDMLKSGIEGVVPGEVCVLLEQLMQGGSQGGQTRKWRDSGMWLGLRTPGVQWHLWVPVRHVWHRPLRGPGGHHQHCRGSQRNWWLEPSHVFSMG